MFTERFGEKVATGRFSIGPGNPNNAEITGGMPEEPVGEKTQLSGKTVYLDGRYPLEQPGAFQNLSAGLIGDGRTALAYRLGRVPEAMIMQPLQSHEEIACPDLPAIEL